MTEKEILEEFKYRYINSKTNNYIFTGIDNFEILSNIPEICSVTLYENSIDIDYAFNIIVDLENVKVKDILTYVLNELKNKHLLDENFDYTIEFNNKFDLFKFQKVLSNYNRMVQIIFYNVDKLSIEEQMLFNELYYFNSIYFDVNAFIKESNFKTYFLTGDRVLDNRENYERVKIVDHQKRLVKQVF